MKKKYFFPCIIISFIIFIISYVIMFNVNKTLNFVINPSIVSGDGVFSQNDIMPEQLLFQGIDDQIDVNKKYGENGRFYNGMTENEIVYIPELATKVNHCPSKSGKINVYLKKHDDGWHFYSKTHIGIGDELYMDYNDTPPYILKPEPHWEC